MRLIGTEIAKMHLADIIHSDLTTSNLMLRHPRSCKSTELVCLFSTPNITCWILHQVLIDFGLAYHSTLVEDKAVDLYVLERAFTSTHPDAEPLFALVLNAYRERMGKEWGDIQRRLHDGKRYIFQIFSFTFLVAVRLRGRKRSMVG